MYLEAFYRVLALLVETCGRLLLPPCKSSSSIKPLSMEEKGLLAVAKNLTSDGYLALQKTSAYDLVCCLFIEN